MARDGSDTNQPERMWQKSRPIHMTHIWQADTHTCIALTFLFIIHFGSTRPSLQCSAKDLDEPRYHTTLKHRLDSSQNLPCSSFETSSCVKMCRKFLSKSATRIPRNTLPIVVSKTKLVPQTCISTMAFLEVGCIAITIVSFRVLRSTFRHHK